MHGYIIILPSCTMFDRANSNVKLASSSRVEVLERSSRVRGVRSSSEARVRVLEFHTLKLASKSTRIRRSRLSSARAVLVCICRGFNNLPLLVIIEKLT